MIPNSIKINQCIIIDSPPDDLSFFLENQFDQILEFEIFDHTIFEKLYERTADSFVLIFSKEKAALSEVLTFFKSKNLIHHIIVFFNKITVDDFSRCINAGVRGFLKNHSTSDDLKICFNNILDKGIYINDSIIQQASKIEKNVSKNDQLNGLTKTEKKVFYLLGQGKTSKEIANLTCNSIRTIQNHRQSIKEKLNIKGYNMLTIVAREHLKQ